ncbi:MAG TPA: hypothetical protein PLK85_07310 [Alphaproteobacteria bacterium]|nr:hypothetical protein [Alphaproteobacteria bacterium]
MSSVILNRVPIIIFSYWIIKIAATTLGETGADYFSMTMNLGYATASVIFMAVFLVFLGIKLTIKKYDPIIYWLVFTSTSIVGTAICDFMDRTLGLGYALGSAVLFISLLVVLALWYYKERSISVENVTTARAEVFYWIAFLIANTLGTAIGDYLADDLGLGFAGGASLIGGLLIVITGMHYYTKISPVVLFWFAFVLTRPFGATFGDFLTKPTEKGGLDLGTIGASVFFIIILVIFVFMEHRAHQKRRSLR